MRKVFIYFMTLLFLLCLPLNAETKEPEQAKETEESKESEKSKKTGRKPVALIVDKDTGDARRIKGMLKDAGFTVKRKFTKKIKVDKYDALVIPGGHNITPGIYGAKRDRHTYGTDIKKDRIQIHAVKKFKKEKKPILGICRGEQLVNVALGGTINQHIGRKKGDRHGWHKGYRKIKIKKDSWLYPVYGKKLNVKHSHHQCVEKLGKNLKATQWDVKSGIIEGYEHETLPVYGIQWHPDLMKKNGGKKVFKKFYKVVVKGTEHMGQKD